MKSTGLASRALVSSRGHQSAAGMILYSAGSVATAQPAPVEL
jgi:hypothetical protein